MFHVYFFISIFSFNDLKFTFADPDSGAMKIGGLAKELFEVPELFGYVSERKHAKPYEKNMTSLTITVVLCTLKTASRPTSNSLTTLKMLNHILTDYDVNVRNSKP